MWTAREKNLSFEQAKIDANKAKKDLKLVSKECDVIVCCHGLHEIISQL